MFAILNRIGDLWLSGGTLATVGKMKVIGARRDRAGVNKKVVYFLLWPNFIVFPHKISKALFIHPLDRAGQVSGREEARSC